MFLHMRGCHVLDMARRIPTQRFCRERDQDQDGPNGSDCVTVPMYTQTSPMFSPVASLSRHSDSSTWKTWREEGGLVCCTFTNRSTDSYNANVISGNVL